jgi:hypothetical protein
MPLLENHCRSPAGMQDGPAAQAWVFDDALRDIAVAAARRLATHRSGDMAVDHQRRRAGSALCRRDGHDRRVFGRHYKSSDEIARDVSLPEGLRAGDPLVVACTGAYHHSMASTFNMVGRPPLVSVKNGCIRKLVRRETVADLLARDRV